MLDVHEKDFRVQVNVTNNILMRCEKMLHCIVKREKKKQLHSDEHPENIRASITTQ